MKDGDAFAEKYNSQLLKFISPNVVMVFSNETPESSDWWRVYHIKNKDSKKIELVCKAYNEKDHLKPNSKGKKSDNSEFDTSESEFDILSNIWL